MQLSRPQRFLNWCAGIFTIVWIGSHLMRLWSAIHRRFHCSGYGTAPLPKMDVTSAAQKMHSFQWRRDGARSLWDAVCTPQKVLAIGFDPFAVTEDNDCDEEGIFLANTVEDPWVLKVEMMTVMWWDPKEGFGGHNVCLLTRHNGVQYMDYGSPSVMVQTEREVAELVLRRYTHEGTLLSWYISDKDLRPLRGSRA